MSSLLLAAVEMDERPAPEAAEDPADLPEISFLLEKRILRFTAGDPGQTLARSDIQDKDQVRLGARTAVHPPDSCPVQAFRALIGDRRKIIPVQDDDLAPANAGFRFFSTFSRLSLERARAPLRGSANPAVFAFLLSSRPHRPREAPGNRPPPFRGPGVFGRGSGLGWIFPPRRSLR